jgi:hypothetical protein
VPLIAVNGTLKQKQARQREQQFLAASFTDAIN